MNAQVNAGGDGSTRVDIRGLTSARTLTLLNGRRVVSGGNGANVSVDLNTIPLAIVERVEVLKDGASAVYGSDAIGGVVNIITRTDFNGSEASLYTGGTQRGDGLAYEASFVTGHASEDKKSSIMFAAGMHKQMPVFAGDRTFSSSDMTYDYVNRTVVPGGSTVVPGGRINTRAIDTNGDGRPDTMELCGAGVQYCTGNGAGGYRPFIAPEDLQIHGPDELVAFLEGRPLRRQRAVIAPCDGTIEALDRATATLRTHDGRLLQLRLRGGCQLRVRVGDELRAGDLITEGERNHRALLHAWGHARLAEHLLGQLEREATSRGVAVPRAYWALAVRAMLRHRRIHDPGDTTLRPGDIRSGLK